MSDESKATKVILWVMRVFIDPLATLVAYAIGVPLHLVGEFLGRKRCPQCGARRLSGHYSKPYPVGVCTRCRSLYKYREGEWVYTGKFEE